MSKIAIHPLTPDRWDAFETLMGPRGACGGCWCLYWKLSRADFNVMRGDATRQMQRSYVESGRIPGLLAYVDDIPAGWVAVEPRSEYGTLGRSRILKPLDDLPVWSIPCFFVKREFRKQGLTVRLLKAAVEHVRQNGGKIAEGYPVEADDSKEMPPVFIYTGLASAFLKADFKEAGRRSARRPIMRYTIK